MDKVPTYDDLVNQHVFARLFDKAHAEWQRCKVVSICAAGIKLKSAKTKEIFVIDNDSVMDDVRVQGAFIPWEREQEPYDGNFCIVFYAVNIAFNLISLHCSVVASMFI